jgi:hypothetical protein
MARMEVTKGAIWWRIWQGLVGSDEVIFETGEIRDDLSFDAFS